jgi:2-alkenal reductase
MRSFKPALAITTLSALVLAACSATSPALGTTLNLAPAPTPASSSPTSAPVSADPALATFQSTLENIYQQVGPSVVNIQVVEQGAAPASGNTLPGLPFRFGGPASPAPQQALGSGFVWDTQGHIVTNYHVVDSSTRISVTFADGTTAEAKVVGKDPNSDLAVIQVDVASDQLHPVQLGDSTQVKVGQLAIAIGNPFGLSGTMTEGIVSGLSRSLPVESGGSRSGTGASYSIPEMIQTDAAMNPGNSGGVLVNDQGQVIGVTTAIQSTTNANSGVGLVIPAAIVQRVVPSLIQTGRYDHSWIGISGTSLTYDLALAMNLGPQQRGALVNSVSSNSPASKAGLRGSTRTASINGVDIPVGGDIITAVDGHPLSSFEDLQAYVFLNTQPGQTVTLSLLRDGRSQTTQLTLGVLPQSQG